MTKEHCVLDDLESLEDNGQILRQHPEKEMPRVDEEQYTKTPKRVIKANSQDISTDYTAIRRLVGSCTFSTTQMTPR